MPSIGAVLVRRRGRDLCRRNDVALSRLGPARCHIVPAGGGSGVSLLPWRLMAWLTLAGSTAALLATVWLTFGALAEAAS
jgi:hypothetical protein